MAPPQSRNATKGNFKGKRKNHRKMWSTPEEIQKQMNRLNMEDEEEEDGTSSSSSSSSDDSDSNSENDLDNVERKPQKPKGVSNLIEIENPNRNPKPVPSDEVQLSRREREELQKQAARERYQKLQAEGKTDQAKADLARLELIRKQREEANLKREMERKEKELSKMGTKTGAKPSSSSFNYEAVDATSAKASNKKK